jgi:hypothetical protein
VFWGNRLGIIFWMSRSARFWNWRISTRPSRLRDKTEFELNREDAKVAKKTGREGDGGSEPDPLRRSSLTPFLILSGEGTHGKPSVGLEAGIQFERGDCASQIRARIDVRLYFNSSRIAAFTFCGTGRT